MSYSLNQSRMADLDYPPTQGALPVWSKVFTKPGERTFLEIIDHPEAKARSAYIWVFIAGTLSGLINSATQFVISLIGLREVMPEFGQVPGMTGALGTAGLLGAVCGAPIAGLFAVAGFAIGTAIIHATAKFFGGQGSFDKLAYAFGACVVPFSLLSAFMVPLNAIPYVAFCTVPVLLGLSLYVLFLEVAAVKAVHRFSWGEAAAAMLFPTILLGLLCGFVFLMFMRAVTPYLNEILQQMPAVP